MIEYDDKFHVTGAMIESLYISSLPYRQQIYNLCGWNENPYTVKKDEHDVYVVLNDFGKKIFSYDIKIERSIYINGDLYINRHAFFDLDMINVNNLLPGVILSSNFSIINGLASRFNILNSVDELPSDIISLLDRNTNKSDILFPLEIIPLTMKSKARLKILS